MFPERCSDRADAAERPRGNKATRPQRKCVCCICYYISARLLQRRRRSLEVKLEYTQQVSNGTGRVEGGNSFNLITDRIGASQPATAVGSLAIEEHLTLRRDRWIVGCWGTGAQHYARDPLFLQLLQP